MKVIRINYFEENKAALDQTVQELFPFSAEDPIKRTAREVLDYLIVTGPASIGQIRHEFRDSSFVVLSQAVRALIDSNLIHRKSLTFQSGEDE